MRARDVAEQIPTVDLDTDAMEAAQSARRRHRIPGLVVLDAERAAPTRCCPAPRCCGSSFRRYVQDDPQLAAVYDEQAADELCGRLSRAGRCGTCCRSGPTRTTCRWSTGDANSMEVAARDGAVAEPAGSGRRRTGSTSARSRSVSCCGHLLPERPR